MKKLIVIIGLLTSGLSFGFDIAANCHFDPSYGECSVVNDTQMPVKCKLQIQGRTSMGYTYNGFEFVFLYPGQYAYAYVYANNPMVDPLVQVSGSAQCKNQ
jgi:hypothetical protein